jgi:hypothetical protein
MCNKNVLPIIFLHLHLMAEREDIFVGFASTKWYRKNVKKIELNSDCYKSKSFISTLWQIFQLNFIQQRKQLLKQLFSTQYAKYKQSPFSSCVLSIIIHFWHWFFFC